MRYRYRTEFVMLNILKKSLPQSHLRLVKRHAKYGDEKNSVMHVNEYNFYYFCMRIFYVLGAVISTHRNLHDRHRRTQSDSKIIWRGKRKFIVSSTSGFIFNFISTRKASRFEANREI